MCLHKVKPGCEKFAEMLQYRSKIVCLPSINIYVNLCDKLYKDEGRAQLVKYIMKSFFVIYIENVINISCVWSFAILCFSFIAYMYNEPASGICIIEFVNYITIWLTR